jgi:hypothetical protein
MNGEYITNGYDVETPCRSPLMLQPTSEAPLHAVKHEDLQFISVSFLSLLLLFGVELHVTLLNSI